MDTVFIPFFIGSRAFPTPPWKIVTFWDSTEDKTLENSLSHLTLEMPLNHLGFDLIYYDIEEALPSLENRPDVAAVLLCFRDGTKMNDPIRFLKWQKGPSTLERR